MDLLAAIAAEPTLLPLWAVLAFAAGMYPVGMLFQCSPCCNTCSACEEGTLPETITVTLDGFSDKSQGPDLCILKFDACYGSGAAGKVTAPGGDPDTDKGPITAVSLANGGSGYALLGRVEPTLTATGSGDGATFTVTVEASEDDCGVDFWKVSKVTASGGTGYTDGEQLTIAVAEGDTAEQDAVVTIKTTRSVPTLAITVDTYGGSGAEFTVATSPNPGTPATWAAASVTVTEGGSGYTDGEYVTVTGDTARDVTVESATGYIRTVRMAPAVEVSVASSLGSGAVLAATFTTGTGSSSGRPVWIVDAITITDGGADYEVGDSVSVTVTDGTEEWSSWFEATVDAVDGSGAIESVTVTSGGEYYKDSGEIEEVVLEVYGTYFGGSYYHDDGVAENATVASGGIYYREDAEQPPYVADITVTIDQTAPSAGAGAEIAATVEADTQSPDFGKIVSLSIVSGGDNYLAHELFDTCLSRLNGRSFVLKKTDKCIYAYSTPRGECVLFQEILTVEYRGPSQPMRLGLSVRKPNGSTRDNGQLVFFPAGGGTMLADSNVEDCSDIDVTATGGVGVPENATATIVGGGDYVAPDPVQVIEADDLNGLYVEVEWDDISAGVSAGQPEDGSSLAVSGCGSYSGISFTGSTPVGDVPWCENWKNSAPDRISTWVTGFPGNPDSFWNMNAQCSQNSTLGFFGGIGVSADCEWRFDVAGIGISSISAVKSRSASLAWNYGGTGIGSGIGFGAVSAGRTCEWIYPVISIPTDADGFPSGVAQLGPPAYSHNPFGTIWGGGPSAVAFWFDDLFSEANACGQPAAPVITFSRLP
jgi:hypothetical protein